MNELNRIFIENMKYYINISKKSQKEIAEAIDVPESTFSTWMKGKAIPRMGKIEMLANYFNINKSDLLEEHKKDEVVFTESEKMLIKAYRNTDKTKRDIVDMILIHGIISRED